MPDNAVFLAERLYSLLPSEAHAEILADW